MLWLVSCGGGGGDGGGSAPSPTPEPANYSGTWYFTNSLAYNDCNLSGMNHTANAINKVTHSGDDVVLVEQSMTLTGTTHDDDGFQVLSQVYTYSNGCIGAVVVRYEDASDGNADAALVFGVQCGSQQCFVGYAGTSVRQSLSTENFSENESDSTYDSFMSECAQQIYEKKSDSSIEESQLDEKNLKEVVINAAKSLISEKRKDSSVQ